MNRLPEKVLLPTAGLENAPGEMPRDAICAVLMVCARPEGQGFKEGP